MSHICVNDKYRSQVGATNRPENIVIPYVSFISLSSICIQRVSAKTLEPNFSVIFQRIFVKFKMQIL
jgi:hypothetical protein